MFQGSFKGVSKKFKGCFMEVSRVFQGSFKDVSRKLLVERAQRKATTIKAYIKKSYDITSVGKAIWKLQAVQAIRFGKQVVTLTKKIIDKLQKIENNVYRYL